MTFRLRETNCHRKFQVANFVDRITTFRFATCRLPGVSNWKFLNLNCPLLLCAEWRTWQVKCSFNGPQYKHAKSQKFFCKRHIFSQTKKFSQLQRLFPKKTSALKISDFPANSPSTDWHLNNLVFQVNLHLLFLIIKLSVMMTSLLSCHDKFVIIGWSAALRQTLWRNSGCKQQIIGWEAEHYLTSTGESRLPLRAKENISNEFPERRKRNEQRKLTNKSLKLIKQSFLKLIKKIIIKVRLFQQCLKW